MPHRILDINSLLLRLAGLVALLSVPFKRLPRGVDDLLPLYNAQASRYTSLLIGISLLYIASQLARKKRSAYYFALVGLVLLIAVELLHFRNPLQLLLYGAVFVSILKDRADYVVKSDADGIRRSGLTALGIVTVVIVFSAVTMSRTDARDFGQDLSVATTLNVIGRSLVSAPLPPEIHANRGGRRIVRLLNVAGIGAGLLIGVSLFQPLKLRRPAPRSVRNEAERIAKQYSNSSEDYLKIWPEDKHYYFYQDSFVAYKVVNGIALVLDGVTGKPNDSGRLRRQFLDYAHGNGWSTAVVHADEAEAEKWERYDMKSIFIGSEAAVETAEFTTKTASDKHFRYVKNKAEKDGLSFDLWQPPLASEQLEQLRSVSDAWLANGKREYTFIMGYFDDNYLANSAVGVLHKDGQLVAYANLLPTYTTGIDSIDHMRSIPGLSQVAMHYLLLKLICERTVQANTREFNLGLAPLSKLEDQALENLSERILPLVKTLGSRYYSFSGLEQFKGKFRPEWEARYITYNGGITRLPVVITALNSATAYKPR
ncbi:MAG: phosphatidylglycerol lysyltransferase domain-containing protein [Patescibacteria group bacterium]|nr:phosphatidylglycerol lysyltransferase domain-containing protein [Patescibacteria group bacterium]